MKKLETKEAIIRAVLGTAGGYGCSIAFMASLAALLYACEVTTRGEASIYAGLAALAVWLVLILMAFLLRSLKTLFVFMSAILVISGFIFFLISPSL